MCGDLAYKTNYLRRIIMFNKKARMALSILLASVLCAGTLITGCSKKAEQKDTPALKEILNQIKYDPKKTWMIGNSLKTDIKGGLLSGIDTCWINKKSQKCSAEIQSTYKVTSLVELYDICTPIRPGMCSIAVR